MSISHYNSYRNYLKKKFGKPVLKIPVSAGFSCPNRDGTKSRNGCSFCDNSSFSPVALCENNPVDQLLSIIQRAKHFDAFLPYLQPFSNTYGSVELLRSVYEPLIAISGVVGLAIGTRPDCFSEAIFSYLKELNSGTYLSIELGLQSSHNSTLEKINRGHTFEEFSKTCETLSRLNIETAAHVMLGLPGETPEMVIKTAQRLAELPVHGVKIHQLMIIKNTEFQRWFEDGYITLLTLQQYAELLDAFISNLRADQYIHRIMADSKPEYGLIGPDWSQHKNESIAFIHAFMDRVGTVQGRFRAGG
ncbi:MAG: TIGR01212 family radical SAM protein [Fibrobacter sp.]|nr:TIGR01212 family radical SAM protein [Fibrobacter sp.]